MKKCPFCAEDVQDAAIVCRYCNRNLPATLVATTAPRRQVNRALIVVLAVIGMVMIAVVGGVVAFVYYSPLVIGDSIPANSETLKFFVRPEVRGLRVTNDTDTVLSGCDVTIASRYTRTETFLKNDSKILSYETFRTTGGVSLDADEGFARAQAGGVTIRCAGREISYSR